MFIRQKKTALGLDLAPLIDVVFQLLVFFMLSSTFLSPSIKLNLPVAAQREAADRERVVVSVDKKGLIFVNTEQVDLSSLEGYLRDILKTLKLRAVHLRGDVNMPYRYFVEVMDVAKRAGAHQVNIVHQRRGEA